MGQLLRRKHIDGSISEYHYYPVDDPIGTRGPNTATDNPDEVCGYLARVVRDANGKKIKNEYAYDDFGNTTTVLDGKSNPARLRYNAMGKVESVISREPFKHRINYKYDANYNEIEAAQSFDRLEYDEANHTTTVTSSTLREQKEYNALDNVAMRQIVGDDKIIIERFIRDADERIIRQVQPLGNATEYIYDERNLLIEKNYGVGTREAFSDRFTYTLNGAVRTYKDGNGNKTAHHYDGFHRYKGFTSPSCTKKTQWFDEAANVVRVEIHGGNGDGVPLMAATYQFDEWNRAYRVDKVWHDYSGGQQLGQSKWNGEKGIVATVLEYGENGLPGNMWTETDNVVRAEYDGVGRVVKMKDLTGEEFSFEYDENNNPILMKYLGPEGKGRRFERVLRRRHDEMDRLDWQQENDEAPERFAYNALGNVINYVGKSGIEIHHVDDSLGRRVGHAFTIADALDNTKVQKIVRRFEYDDNYRLSAYTDAAGKRTAYRYDTLDRQTGVVFPDGNAANVQYDANGNAVRIVDQNNNKISNRYDAANRLVERQSRIKAENRETVEQYEYDGLSRMVAAIAPDSVIKRTYDSLSRLVTEQQGNHELRCGHDSAGNLTSLVYPTGEEVHKAYDIRNRVTSVKNKAGETVASFMYRASGQIARLLLGNVIESDFSYNQQERVESIEYKRTDNQNLVEGFRYQYDETGRMTHEIQLSVGATYGERYYYDNANRATKAQYGVQNVFDPNSSFEQETSYEHFPEGSWKRRFDVDGQGQTIDEKIGTINELNNYQEFGNISFAYDANGNCIRKGTSNPGWCTYTYGVDNRLDKADCYDAQGNKTQTIEYFYDSFGRQRRKVVTDQNGNITEYTYVWVGRLLIEEYENGVLVRRYVYGIGLIPVLFTVNNDGRIDYYYPTRNGKELVSGLVNTRGPNAFAEKYYHEVTGASFMMEINGVKVGIPSRHSTVSSLLNSIVSGDYLRDWQNGTSSRIGGRHANPELASVLNGGNGFKGYTGGAWGAFMSQLNDLGFGNMTGRGDPGKGRTSGLRLPPGVELNFRAPNWSLYSQTAKGVFFRYVGGYIGQELARGAMERMKGERGGAGGAEGGSGSDKEYQKEKEAQAKADKEKREKEQDAAFKRWQEEKAAEAKAKKEEKEKKEREKKEEEKKEEEKEEEEKKQEEGGTYVDPDSAFGVSMELPSPQQVEAKLMQNKKPVNPNGGLGSPEIDTSSPPSQRRGGLDPTIAYIDSELGFGEDFGGRTIISGGDYTTYVRGWEPVTPSLTQIVVEEHLLILGDHGPERKLTT